MRLLGVWVVVSRALLLALRRVLAFIGACELRFCLKGKILSCGCYGRVRNGCTLLKCMY